MTLNLLLCKIQPTVYIRIANPSPRQVILASRTNFLDINTLARLTRTTLEVAIVTEWLDLGQKFVSTK